MKRQTLKEMVAEGDLVLRNTSALEIILIQMREILWLLFNILNVIDCVEHCNEISLEIINWDGNMLFMLNPTNWFGKVVFLFLLFWGIDVIIYVLIWPKFVDACVSQTITILKNLTHENPILLQTHEKKEIKRNWNVYVLVESSSWIGQCYNQFQYTSDWEMLMVMIKSRIYTCVSVRACVSSVHNVRNVRAIWIVKINVQRIIELFILVVKLWMLVHTMFPFRLQTACV